MSANPFDREWRAFKRNFTWDLEMFFKIAVMGACLAFLWRLHNPPTYAHEYGRMSQKTNLRNYVHRYEAVSVEACENVIKVAETKEFRPQIKARHLTDDLPMYEIDLVRDGHRTRHHHDLWEAVLPILRSHIIMHNKLNHKLEEVCLKRYAAGERSHLLAHHEPGAFQIAVLLSDTAHFDGGQMYAFTRHAERYKDIFPHDHKMNVPHRHKLQKLKMMENIMDNQKYLPILHDYGQGDILFFTRDIPHGILPVTRGVRYELTFHFH